MKAILFALFVALLMVGCGESSTPSDPLDSWTTPEVLEDATADAVDWSKLQDRDGVIYLPNTDKPFSGYAKRAYEHEQVEILAKFKNGYVVRLKQWQMNGNPSFIIGYMEGKVGVEGMPLEWPGDSNSPHHDGLVTSWYENGQKMSESNWKEGKQDGLFTLWYMNGQKQGEIRWKDGKMDGFLTAWYENGQKDAEGKFKDGELDGLETLWYKNGQNKSEANYKDGIIMSAEVWKPNGEKCPVTNIKDGNGVIVDYLENGTERRRYTYKFGKLIG